MFTLKILFYSIIFIEVFTIIYNIIKLLVFKIYNIPFAKTHNLNYNNDFHLYVLIPCYKEKKVIKNTIQYFLKLINKNSNIDFYIITTQKEKAENPSSLTTYDYTLNLNIKNKKFHILNYPHINGMMADQLNYAINKILESQNLPKDRIYFSIYNADSHPDNSTFIELSDKIRQYNFPKIIQQYSNFFFNAVWFKTASHHYSIFKDIKSRNRLSQSGLIWLSHELRASFVWIFMPIFILYTFIYPIISRSDKLFLLAIVTYLAFVFVNYLLNILVVNFKRFHSCIKNYFSTCLAVLLTCTCPIYSLFLKEKIKTER